MKDFFVTLLIGIVAGAIDVLPMIKMKLDRHSIASAFVFYLILPFVILNIDLYGLAWWIKGGVTGLALALPVVKDGISAFSWRSVLFFFHREVPVL